ncbi:diguanylate cyclase [Acidobacteriota bacterium]
MRRRLQPFIPVLLFLLCLGVILRFGSPLAQWSAKAERALLVPPLFILVLFSLILPLISAFLFHQTRIVLAAGLFAITYLLAEGVSISLSEPSQILLAPILSLQIAFLTCLRDRGLFNRLGLLRLVVIAAPYGALIYLDSDSPSVRQALAGSAGWIFKQIGGLNTPVVTIVITVIALIAILRLRGAEYPVITPSIAVALVAAVVALDAPSPVWPEKSAGVVRPLGFITAGLSLAWSVYLLSWGRAYQDLLTGLPSRRALEEKLERLSGTYSLVMVDVDRFKRFNDRYGHETGDDVLRLVAGVLDKHAPGTAYRYGGEEFTLVCPGRSAQDLKDDLNGLRVRIAKTKLTLRSRGRVKKAKKGKTSVTASFGAAEKNEKRSTPDKVLKAADKALYRAKRTGRNRVCVS